MHNFNQEHTFSKTLKLLKEYDNESKREFLFDNLNLKKFL